MTPGTIIPIWPYRQRPCMGCRHRVRTWGVAHCAMNRWDDLKYEQRCELHPDSAPNPDAPLAAGQVSEFCVGQEHQGFRASSMAAAIAALYIAQ